MAQLTEEVQNVALRALATTLGKPVSEIEATLLSDKPDDVDALVSARIKSIRDEGDKAGKGKLQKAANRKAKEVFKIDDEPETIEALIDKIKEAYVPEVDPTKLTEEQVKMHPSFRNLETQLSTKDADHRRALETAVAQGEAKAMKAQLTAKAIKALADYGAVISTDSKIAAVQERMFLEGLDGIEPKEVEGKIEFWKEGRRIENDKLFPVNEADFFKGLVEKTYTTKVSDQKEGTGLPPGSGQQQQQGTGSFTHFKGTPPKTLEEYNAILSDRDKNSLDARKEVMKYWEDSQPK